TVDEREDGIGERPRILERDVVSDAVELDALGRSRGDRVRRGFTDPARRARLGGALPRVARAGPDAVIVHHGLSSPSADITCLIRV
ncbi:MAG: hypothetical protein ACTHPS_06950, partial [Streptosporangiaceae bacterium]